MKMNYIRLISLFLIINYSASGQNGTNVLTLFDDFIATPTSTGNIFQTTTSGGNATSIDVTESGQQGILRLSTGTSAAGRAHVGTYNNALTAGGGEWGVTFRIDSINVLCDNTERYAILIGFFDTYTGVDQFDGIYFLYDSIGTTAGSASSDKWQTVTFSNGLTSSFVTTSKTVDTGDHTFGIYVNSDGTSVDFSIDGESVRTETTGIPAGRGRTFGFGAMIVKSAGSTARQVYLDYMSAEYAYALYRQ